jgi:hypothetical protein
MKFNVYFKAEITAAAAVYFAILREFYKLSSHEKAGRSELSAAEYLEVHSQTNTFSLSV